MLPWMPKPRGSFSPGAWVGMFQVFYLWAWVILYLQEQEVMAFLLWPLRHGRKTAGPLCSWRVQDWPQPAGDVCSALSLELMNQNWGFTCNPSCTPNIWREGCKSHSSPICTPRTRRRVTHIGLRMKFRSWSSGLRAGLCVGLPLFWGSSLFVKPIPMNVSGAILLGRLKAKSAP